MGQVHSSSDWSNGTEAELLAPQRSKNALLQMWSSVWALVATAQAAKLRKNVQLLPMANPCDASDPCAQDLPLTLLFGWPDWKRCCQMYTRVCRTHHHCSCPYLQKYAANWTCRHLRWHHHPLVGSMTASHLHPTRPGTGSGAEAALGAVARQAEAAPLVEMVA